MHQIQLLKKYGLSVRGARGQHLLVDENIQQKFASLVRPEKGETIIEIGPGLGAITESLLASGAKVIAIEQDPRFIEILQGELAQDFKTLTLVKADILKVDLKKYVRGKDKLKIVGNIPYYITSPILLHLIKHGFAARRKNILNAISDGLKNQMAKQEVKALLNEAGLEETARAEELMLKDFIRLAELFSDRLLSSKANR